MSKAKRIILAMLCTAVLIAAVPLLVVGGTAAMWWIAIFSHPFRSH